MERDSETFGSGPVPNLDAVMSALVNGKVLPPGGASSADLNVALAQTDLNDLGNAQRFLSRFGEDVLYVQGIGWHVWDGVRWVFDEKGRAVRRRAHDTARSIVEEAGELQANPPETWGKSKVSERAAALMKWSISSGNSNKVNGMMTEAEAYRAVAPDAMDADQFALNLANGTLVLEGDCSELRPHARGDRLSKVMPVDYDPAATCPNFMAFLDRVQPPETGVAKFLQIWSGYCLTGATGAQALLFHFGQGANGKGVFLTTRSRIMGPYAAAVDYSSIAANAAKRGDSATPDLARLPGVRFARVSEVEKSVRLSEGFVKQVTGGDAITVRHLNQGFFEFEPRFKLEMQGNHKPVIVGADEGIWRRLILVPWNVIIPKAERDETLPAKLWEERSGILNWMLDGLRLWLDGGLVLPKAVLDATAEYRLDSDQFGRFLGSVVEVTGNPDDGIRANDLFKLYVDWCAENGEKLASQTSFGRGMIERGLRRVDGRHRTYVGVRIRPYDDAECEGL